MTAHVSNLDLTIGGTRGTESPSSSARPHVLIVGGGITGLLLAQALKRSDVPFTVFERDPGLSHRGRGWGLTIHWALDTLMSLLPQHIIDRVPEIYVNPQASTSGGDNGNFLFFDLRSGETRWTVPPAKRIRVSRERLRALLAEGVDVQWTKSITKISTDPNSITAHFSDHTTAKGTLLVGADGSRSSIRSLLAPTPDISLNQRLPVRLLGVSVVYPSSLALKMRALSPFFLQGGDPETNVYFWFSFLDTPTNNSRKENPDSYECQILTSWPYKVGFQGREEPLEIPSSNEERIGLMKSFVQNWAEPFKGVVDGIPLSTEVKSISLEDWPPGKGMWDNLDGRATMVGDAAHTMTMFRGDGANQGIEDVSVLLSNIVPLLAKTPPASFSLMKGAIDTYEDEMIARTAPAVLTSRAACLDAHDYQRITDKSPLVMTRAMVTDSNQS
ncbi:hypothetical protein MMC07_008475 [Pseudocyphellaria aurata]|nr:hypothetical protein [Pseudocyphellaria aurata]